MPGSNQKIPIFQEEKVSIATSFGSSNQISNQFKNIKEKKDLINLSEEISAAILFNKKLQSI